MCTVSMIMDHYRDRWTQQPIQDFPFVVQPSISPEEVAEFRRLLERAREYDKRHNEPDCELDEKKRALLAIAETLGIDISFVETREPAPSVGAVREDSQ